MMAMMRLLAIFWLAVLPASAGLLFEKSVIEVKVTPEQKRVVVEFPFTVIGNREVVIGEYDAPCTCLEARISDNGRLKWQPGEKGSVQGVFDVGNLRGGILEKMIVLRMKGEKEPSVKLTIKMDLPILLEIEPKTLIWDQGKDVKPMTFKLKVKHTKPMKILETSGTNENFPFEVKTIKEGWEYEIVVTPKTLKDRGFGMIRIKTDSDLEKHVGHQAFVAIRGSGR